MIARVKNTVCRIEGKVYFPLLAILKHICWPALTTTGSWPGYRITTTAAKVFGVKKKKSEIFFLFFIPKG